MLKYQSDEPVSCELPHRPRAHSENNHLSAPPASKAQGSKPKHQRTQSEFPLKTIGIGLKESINEEWRTERVPNLSSEEHLHSDIGITSGAEMDEQMRLPSGVTLESQSRLQDTALDNPANSHVVGSPISVNDLTAMDMARLKWQPSNSKDRVGTEDTSGLKNNAIQKPVHGDQSIGVGFDELVDRLLSQAKSKTDVKFVAIFLCLYRQFSAPSALLDAVISRFETVDLGSSSQAIRLTTQLRHLSVLATWVSEYPGDFAHPLTRVKMSNFTIALAGQRQFSMAIKEIGFHLDVVSADDDTFWAVSDATESMTDDIDSSLTGSSVQSAPLATADQRDTTDDAFSNDKGARAIERGSATPSAASSAGKSSDRSNTSLEASPKSVEIAQAQGRLPVAPPRAALCKIHWHYFMELSDEDVARELTRIDWALFSSIRPRDLIRHVSLTEEYKGKYKDLDNVKRMIDLFNHTSFWIANIILLREKPKHRARALEKCIAIAWVRLSDLYGVQ